jgi:hypothetical protein
MALRTSDTLTRRMPSKPPLELFLGDVVRLRRRHPCGGTDWRIDRLGADIGLRCTTCRRHVLLDRVLLERRLVMFIERGDPEINAAVESARPRPPADGSAGL